MVYEPAEDSYLLQKYVKRYAKGSVLDIGTGSGIQAITAAGKKSVSKVTAVDIDKEAIKYCRNRIKDSKITFKESDLFSSIKSRFDTIIFNPPYLPALKGEKDIALSAAKHGYEIVERFIKDASSHLTEKGIILLIFSSLTKKNKVDEIINNALFEFRELESISFFFEKIYCYKITRSSLLRDLERLGLKDTYFFSKGKRGKIYSASYNDKAVAIKIANPSSRAEETIRKESGYLKLLNKRGIGPKLLFASRDYIVMDLIEGIFIKDYIIRNKKKKIIDILSKMMDQLYMLDTLCLNKEEMHKPLKHIMIRNDLPILIDFERMHKTEKPKNITQFIQFLFSIKLVLKEKGISPNFNRLRALSKIYKEKITEENLHYIKAELLR